MMTISHLRRPDVAPAEIVGASPARPQRRDPEPQPVWTPPPRFSFIGMYLIPHPRRVTLEQIKAAVVQHYGLDRLDLQSQRREDARPRQIAMYLAKHLTSLSYVEIGRRIGGRDHSTVVHGVRQIERLRAIDPALNAAIGELMGKLG